MSVNHRDEFPDDLEKELLTAIQPESVDPAQTRKLKARIMAQLPPQPHPDTFTLPAQEGDWIEIAPKAEMKLLREDKISRSFLLRLYPGAVLPAHDHPVEEECLVLEGELQIGNITVRAGDYHMAPKGVSHGEARSEMGALVFIRGANL